MRNQEYTEEPAKSPQEWAEHFGRKVIDGLIEGRDLQWVEGVSRMAATFARIHLDELQWEAHRENVARGWKVIQEAF